MEDLGCGGWFVLIAVGLVAAIVVVIAIGYFLHVGWSGFTPSPV